MLGYAVKCGLVVIVNGDIKSTINAPSNSNPTGATSNYAIVNAIRGI